MHEPDDQVVSRQLAALASEGLVVDVDPDDAEMMAAFEDDALSAEDAMESRFDTVAEG